MAKSDRIVTRLESEIRARLHAKASALGLDDAAYVRMLIYRDLNGPALPNPRQFIGGRSEAAAAVATENYQDLRGNALLLADGQIVEEPEPLPVEEIDIPADADGGDPGALEELLAAGPTFLDEMVAMSQPAAHATPARHSEPSRAMATRGYRAPLSRRHGTQPAYGPGSMTRAIGVNDQVIGANDFGDGPGNVQRDNMRHFIRSR